MIKKLKLLLLGALMVFGASASAQVAPAKFFDNTTVSVQGGVTMPLNDIGDPTYGQVGVQIEKGITPWVAVAADGLFGIGIDDYNTHTAFDRVQVSGLVKFNLFNLLGTYKGERRVFEIVPFTGLGWNHTTASERTNSMLYKAGVDFEFNLGAERAWAVRLSPAVNWDTASGMKLRKKNAELQINVGVAYHFKNADGNRYFTMVRPYDQAEVDALNARVNELRSTNEALIAALAEKPKEVIVEKLIEKEPVTEVKVVLPTIGFQVGSSHMLGTNLLNLQDIADEIKEDGGEFVITGYASVEGPEALNQNLSLERANTVKNALVKLGVDPQKLTVEAEGATDRFGEGYEYNRVVIVENK